MLNARAQYGKDRRDAAEGCDRFWLMERLRHSTPMDKTAFIQEKCRKRSVLDLGCVRHDADFALSDPNWLHAKIRAVANEVVGVDYVASEVEKVKAHGFNVVFGDVTKPLPLTQEFDVIVAADLIEHLTNFDGFFENCSRLLKPEGALIVTTPNPFYAGEFHYVAFKGNILINPEHTCWIDPQALLQLSMRYAYVIDEISYIVRSWQLENFICETKRHAYDIFKGTWSDDSFRFKVIRRVVASVFRKVYRCYRTLTFTNSILVKYSDYMAVLRRV